MQAQMMRMMLGTSSILDSLSGGDWHRVYVCGACIKEYRKKH